LKKIFGLLFPLTFMGLILFFWINKSKPIIEEEINKETVITQNRFDQFNYEKQKYFVEDFYKNIDYKNKTKDFFEKLSKNKQSVIRLIFLLNLRQSCDSIFKLNVDLNADEKKTLEELKKKTQTNIDEIKNNIYNREKEIHPLDKNFLEKIK